MRKCRLGILVTVFNLLAAAAGAQQGSSTIQGRVIDETGASLPGVTLVATNESTGIFRQTVTSSDGAYLLSNLVPGRYRLSGELTGFKRLVREDIGLDAGATQVQDLTLQLGALDETILCPDTRPQ